MTELLTEGSPLQALPPCPFQPRQTPGDEPVLNCTADLTGSETLIFRSEEGILKVMMPPGFTPWEAVQLREKGGPSEGSNGLSVEVTQADKGRCCP